MREICIYRPQVSPQEFSKPSNDKPAQWPLMRTKHTAFCLIAYNIITIRVHSIRPLDDSIIVFFTAENVTVEFTDTINEVLLDNRTYSNAIVPDDLQPSRQQYGYNSAENTYNIIPKIPRYILFIRYYISAVRPRRRNTLRID